MRLGKFSLTMGVVGICCLLMGGKQLPAQVAPTPMPLMPSGEQPEAPQGVPAKGVEADSVSPADVQEKDTRLTDSDWPSEGDSDRLTSQNSRAKFNRNLSKKELRRLKRQAREHKDNEAREQEPAQESRTVSAQPASSADAAVSVQGAQTDIVFEPVPVVSSSPAGQPGAAVKFEEDANPAVTSSPAVKAEEAAAPEQLSAPSKQKTSKQKRTARERRRYLREHPEEAEEQPQLKDAGGSEPIPQAKNSGGSESIPQAKDTAAPVSAPQVQEKTARPTNVRKALSPAVTQVQQTPESQSQPRVDKTTDVKPQVKDTPVAAPEVKETPESQKSGKLTNAGGKSSQLDQNASRGGAAFLSCPALAAQPYFKPIYVRVRIFNGVGPLEIKSNAPFWHLDGKALDVSWDFLENNLLAKNPRYTGTEINGTTRADSSGGDRVVRSRGVTTDSSLGASQIAPSGSLGTRCKISVSSTSGRASKSSSAPVQVKSASDNVVPAADYHVDAAESVNQGVQQGTSVKIRANSKGRCFAFIPASTAKGACMSVNGLPYRGSLLVYDHGTSLEVVNVVDVEEYVLGVVPKELLCDQLDAMKAQAVVARTYAFAHRKGGKAPSKGPRSHTVEEDLSQPLCLQAADGSLWDVRSDVRSQVYGGVRSEQESASQACRETEGLVLCYEGKPVRDALYHSTCGGQTEGNAAVFGTKPVPYLKSVPCRTADDVPACAASNYSTWSTTWDAATLGKELSAFLGKSYSCVKSLDVKERGESGRVVRIAVTFTDGSQSEISRENIRKAFYYTDSSGRRSSLPSTYFILEPQGRSSWKVSGLGWGHGLGLCQWGAKGLAREGRNFVEILRHYYTGTEVLPEGQAL